MSTSPISEPPDSPLARYLEDKKQPLLMLAAAAAVIAALVLVSEATKDEGPTPADGPVTCLSYTDEMSATERKNLAMSTLATLRNADGSGRPRTAVVDAFAGAVYAACQDRPTTETQDVAASVYVNSSPLYSR